MSCYKKSNNLSHNINIINIINIIHYHDKKRIS